MEMGSTADLDGGLELEEDRLVDEDIPGLDAQPAHFRLGQVHLLAGARPIVIESE